MCSASKTDHKPATPENYALMSGLCDAKGQRASKLDDWDVENRYGCEESLQLLINSTVKELR